MKNHKCQLSSSSSLLLLLLHLQLQLQQSLVTYSDNFSSPYILMYSSITDQKMYPDCALYTNTTPVPRSANLLLCLHNTVVSWSWVSRSLYPDNVVMSHLRMHAQSYCSLIITYCVPTVVSRSWHHICTCAQLLNCSVPISPVLSTGCDISAAHARAPPPPWHRTLTFTLLWGYCASCLDLGWGTSIWTWDVVPPCPDLGWVTPPPVEVWTDKQTENSTFPHLPDAGGKYLWIPVIYCQTGASLVTISILDFVYSVSSSKGEISEHIYSKIFLY